MGINSENPECVIAAIERLHGITSSEVIDVLVSYIDFQRPTEKYIQLHPPITKRVYPATNSLFSIVKPALSALTHVIQEAKSSDVARRNAISMIMSIHREEPQEGVRLLVNAASKATDAAQAQRLKQGATEAAQKCDARARSQCDAMLKAGSN